MTPRGRARGRSDLSGLQACVKAVDLTDDGTKDCGSGRSGEMPAMTDAKPDIFLCHNSADKDWVIHLAERLEAESIDATEDGRRIRVFLDAWDIEKGENIVARLGTELATGAFVAAVMSPEFFGSDWTKLEWTDIVARDPTNASGKLLPLQVRDASLAAKTRVAFPAPFNALRHFDFRSEARFEVEFQDLLRRIRKLPLP